MAAIIPVTAMCVSISIFQSLVAASTIKVCPTDTCNAAADRMLKLMDTNAKPCQDFNKYACGSFLKNIPIPPSQSSVGSFADISAKDKKLFKEILKNSTVRDSPNSFERKMKSLYKACVNEASLETHGLKDYKDSYKQDWPTLNPAWVKKTFSLQKTTDKYLKMFTEVLFSVSLTIDNKGPVERYMLQIADPSLLLSQRNLVGAGNGAKIAAYQKYYTDVAMALGACQPDAEDDAKDFIAFVKKIGQHLLKPRYTWDVEKTTNPSTLEQMNNKYNYLNWVQAIQSIYNNMGVTIQPSQKVNLRNPGFLEGLKEVLSKTDTRTIQNFFGFTQAVKVVGEATKEMRNIRFEFDKVISGRTQQTPRDRFCVEKINDLYNVGMAKLISKSRYTEKAKTFMDKMIGDLKAIFINNIHNMTWMEPKTKAKAILKVKEMKEKIGVLSEKFENSDIDAFYKKFVVGENNFNTDLLQNRQEEEVLDLQDLNQPLQDSRWIVSMTSANAWNVRWTNEIVFALGLMQPPFFNQDSPSYLNYGAIGYFIGHEIGHAFDASGRKYDERGRIANWWTPRDLAQYQNRTQCFVDQYSRFQVKELNIMLNGDRSKTENVADNLGALHAYQAYRKHEDSLSKDNQELPLPKLRLTNDQLFFLALAQTWCYKYTTEKLRSKVEGGTYAPPSKRIIGIMQNSQEFAKAYGCKDTDYMNPATKCAMW